MSLQLEQLVSSVMLDHDKILEQLMQAYEHASATRMSLQEASSLLSTTVSSDSSQLDDVRSALQQVRRRPILSRQVSHHSSKAQGSPA